jgi:hypothetical protein
MREDAAQGLLEQISANNPKLAIARTKNPVKRVARHAHTDRPRRCLVGRCNHDAIAGKFRTVERREIVVGRPSSETGLPKMVSAPFFPFELVFLARGNPGSQICHYNLALSLVELLCEVD